MLHELRHALRALSRDPTYALPALLLLAVGVGSNTAMLSILDAYLFRPLPFPDADRLVSVRPVARDAPPSLRETVPEGLDGVAWPERDAIVEEAVTWDLDVFTLVSRERPEVVSGAWVSPSYFRALGTRPVLGRLIDDSDGRPGAPPVVVLGHDLWRRRYGGRSDVVGQTLSFYASDRPDDPETGTVVGVAPADFWFVNPYTEMFTNLTARQIPYLVRLRPGVTTEQAAAHLTGLVRAQLAGVDPEWPGMVVSSIRSGYVRQIRPVLWIATAAVGFVLLIACGNVALLLVVRSLGRQRELTIRRALGASTWRVSRQLATEGILLAVAAGLVGIVLASWVLRGAGPIVQAQLGVDVPGSGTLGIGATALAVALATCLVVGLVFGLAPAVSTLPRDLATALRRSRSGVSDTGPKRRLRNGLIAGEVALSLILLVGCLLMLRSAVHLHRLPLGFEPDGVVSAYVSLRQHSYDEPSELRSFASRYLDRVRALPGVSSASLVGGSVPFQSGSTVPVLADASSAASRAALYRVATEYFETLSIALVRGRPFSEADREDAAPVVILSEGLADELFSGEDAVGRRVRVGDEGDGRTVVAVARDVRESLTDEENLPDAYVPYAQMPAPYPHVLVKLSRPPSAVVSAMERAVWEIDDTAAVTGVELMADRVAREWMRPRFLAVLLTAFGVFAVMLAAAGLYATVAYGVRQMRRDLAIRMALGADGTKIVRLVAQHALVLIVAGVAGGLLSSVVLTRALASQLHGVTRLDLPTYLAATLLLASTALVSIWLPARRAAETDPTAVLRQD